jgi:hypothetical protein
MGKFLQEIFLLVLLYLDSFKPPTYFEFLLNRVYLSSSALLTDLLIF